MKLNLRKYNEMAPRHAQTECASGICPKFSAAALFHSRLLYSDYVLSNMLIICY